MSQFYVECTVRQRRNHNHNHSDNFDIYLGYIIPNYIFSNWTRSCIKSAISSDGNPPMTPLAYKNRQHKPRRSKLGAR
jgi:hypothetical protein